MGTENYTGNLIGRRQSEYARIFFSFWLLVLPLRERNKFYGQVKHIKLYPFQNLSHGLIIFLNFSKFQPRYSYKILYNYPPKAPT